ncbi:DUF4376 domain-containing protein [Avibacterium paragallinarum]|uniref:DUF4376 domain-containing protein n=2 Tax=Avibacterium paragallinarum TaxID=728 RepID=UPI001A931948|nr:DUF4376 domain-containing protein [Avibacterium paragallinarum]
MYYRAGFYLDLAQAPEGAVGISDETYRTLLEGQSQGKQIIANEQGYPILVDPQPSPYHRLQGSEWVIDEDKKAELLASQQAQVWELIKQKRYQNCRSGVYVKSVDKWFHSDDASRQQYTFMRTLPDFPPTQWKTMDNSFVEMTKALLNELSLALFAHEQADFANAERHRLAMLAVDNPLDYDYSTGWQEVFNG